MRINSKQVHAIIIAILFSVINWLLISSFIVDISFIKWIIIEIVLGFSLKLYNFTITKIQ